MDAAREDRGWKGRRLAASVCDVEADFRGICHSGLVVISAFDKGIK